MELNERPCTCGPEDGWQSPKGGTTGYHYRDCPVYGQPRPVEPLPYSTPSLCSRPVDEEYPVPLCWRDVVKEWNGEQS